MSTIELCGQTLDLDNLQSGYFNMDCMDGMAKFPDKYFDLAVVDPPYGIGMSGGMIGGGVAKAQTRDYKHFAGNDAEPPKREYFTELMRISRNQIIFGANHFIDRLPPPRNSSCWIVWDKQQTAHFADAELAWTSFKSHVRVFRYRWNGMLQENMKNKEYKFHPSQKPVDLYKWIFDTFAEKDQRIIDTHVGSASSLIAAHDAGLTYIGFEIDEYYYKLSKKRLDQYTAQMSIFDLGVERE